MNFFSVSYEAQSRYDEKLRSAEERRRVEPFIARRGQARPGLLVRAGEVMVTLGERLKHQGKPAYAYSER